MLKENGVAFTYREYTKEPLSEAEIREVLDALGMGVKDILRRNDVKKAGLTGDEADDVLIAAMTEHPRMMQRPIGVLDGKAEVGRPVDNLLKLLG